MSELSPELLEAYTVEDSGRQFELAGNPSGRLRIALAQNPKLHPDVQKLLTKDSSTTVRNSLTKNPNITEAIQLKLAKDKFDVKDSLAENPNLTQAVQLYMINKPKQSESILEFMGRNPNISFESMKALLPKLEQSSSGFDYVAKNSNTLEKQKYLVEYAKSKDADNASRYRWRTYMGDFMSNAPILPEIEELLKREAMTSSDGGFVKSVLDAFQLDEEMIQQLYKKFKPGILAKDKNKAVISAIAEQTKSVSLQKTLYENGFAENVVDNPHLNKELAISIIDSAEDSGVVRDIATNFGGKENSIDDDIAIALMNRPENDEGWGRYRNIRGTVAKRASERIQKYVIEKIKSEIGGDDLANGEELLRGVAGGLSENDQKSLETERFILEHGDRWNRESIAGSSQREEIHNAILATNEYRLLNSLSGNPNLSEDVKASMLDNSNNMEFLEDLSSNTDMVERSGEKIFNKAVEILRSGKGGHHVSYDGKVVEEESAEAIQERFLEILGNLSRRTNKIDLLESLSKTRSPKVWSGLASNESLPKEMQKLLITGGDLEEVFPRLALREDLLPEVQKILSISPSKDVKESLYENDFVLPEIKSYLKKIMSVAKKYSWDTWREDEKAPPLDEQNSLLTISDPYINKKLAGVSGDKDILSAIYDANNPVILEQMAQNKMADNDTYRKLYALNNEEVDSALFENPNVPVDIKELFFDRYKSTDKATYYKRRLLEQGFASKEMQMQILEDSKGNETAEGSKRKLEEIFSKLLSIKNLDPGIQMQLAAAKGAFIRAKLATNPNLSPEVQSILLTDRASSVRKLMASNPVINEETQRVLATDKIESVRRELAANPKISDSTQAVLTRAALETGDEDTALRLLNNDKLSPKAQEEFIEYGKTYYLRRLADNPNLTRDIQLKLMKDDDRQVRDNLSNNDALHPEIRVRLNSKPPKDFDKNEFVTKVHKNKYVFRILEKYMEDNDLTQLEAKNFKGTPIERYRQQPLVDAMFKENNGKPLSIEHIKKALEKLDAKEFYVYHGDFSSGIQSHKKFSTLPRHSFALLFKDLESDPQTLEFMKDVAPNMAHGNHGSMGGWGEMNMGWILWKDITKIVGKPAVLIEQVQSDWRGLMSKIKAMKDDINHPQNWQAERMVDDWIEQYGEDSLPRIQKNLDALVKDYPEKLMAAFLSSSGVRGKTVYITDKETQRGLVGHSEGESVMLDTIYERMPAAFGFKQAEDIPGFLKLERASTRALVATSGYRKFISQKVAKITNRSA